MDMKLVLDIVAITSSLFSVAFWLASNYLYKDVIRESKEFKADMLLLFEKQEIGILSRIERQIQKNITRISTSESRLKYLENLLVKDPSYNAFLDKMGDLFEDTDL